MQVSNQPRPPGQPEADAVAELERQRRRSDLLLALSSTLSSMQDGDQIARAVCVFIRDASGAPFSMVARRAPGTNRFEILATDGLDDDQVERIRQALARTDRPSLKELLGGGTSVRTGEDAVGPGMGIERAMAAPLTIGGQTEGFIAIGAPAGDVIREDEWLELLLAFAALTATAFARADAVNELARQRDLLASEVEERTRSLRAAVDELRLASDAKTAFLANVSHELRTPLTAILGFVEILATGLDGPLNADQQRDVETVQASSHHLLELIDDLIDVASIEGGRIELDLAPISARDVARDAAETIRPLAGAKGIALELAGEDGEDDEELLVSADRSRLREILLNLLSNAVKFTPANGRVRIEIGLAAPQAADRDAPSAGPPMVVIAVRDTGSGIDPADLERIFEKFVRIAAVSTPGTGLGLPISRELARLHGGELTVESIVGVGSVFSVLIPQAVA
jgi:signal transduction histidine kinase